MRDRGGAISANQCLLMGRQPLRRELPQQWTRECGERRGVDSAAAAGEHAFPPLNLTLTNDAVSQNIPRAPRAAAL